jgi:hypothetical protein
MDSNVAHCPRMVNPRRRQLQIVRGVIRSEKICSLSLSLSLCPARRMCWLSWSSSLFCFLSVIALHLFLLNVLLPRQSFDVLLPGQSFDVLLPGQSFDVLLPGSPIIPQILHIKSPPEPTNWLRWNVPLEGFSRISWTFRSSPLNLDGIHNCWDGWCWLQNQRSELARNWRNP